MEKSVENMHICVGGVKDFEDNCYSLKIVQLGAK